MVNNVGKTSGPEGDNRNSTGVSLKTRIRQIVLTGGQDKYIRSCVQQAQTQIILKHSHEMRLKTKRLGCGGETLAKNDKFGFEARRVSYLLAEIAK